MNRVAVGSMRALSATPSAVLNSSLRFFSTFPSSPTIGTAGRSAFHSSAISRADVQAPNSTPSSSSSSSSSPSSSSGSDSGSVYRVIKTTGMDDGAHLNPETERRITATFFGIGLLGIGIYLYGVYSYPVEEVKNWNGQLAPGEKRVS